MTLLPTLTPAPAEGTPLRHFLSTGKVVSEQRYLGDPRASGVPYPDGEPLLDGPVVPFLAWGLRFDDDLVVSLSGDPGWSMIEVTRVFAADGTAVWFTLDSRIDGTQYVGVPRGDARAREIASRFPAPVYETDLAVRERTFPGGRREFHVSYTRLAVGLEAASPIAFEMEVGAKGGRLPSRNGNAMNHSQGTALAVLDLTSLAPAWGGVRFAPSADVPARRAQRLAGIPAAGLLRQSAAGLMRAEWEQASLGLLTIESPDGSVTLRSEGPITRTDYVFERAGRALELRAIHIIQPRADGGAGEVAGLRFNPSLPDLRFGAPAGDTRSRATVSVNGRPGYMKGEVFVSRSSSPDGAARIEFVPERPRWASARPVVSWVSVSGAGARGRSAVLASGAPAFSASAAWAIDAGEEIQAFAGVDLEWERIPHRTSALEFRAPGAWGAGDPGEALLRGGTWADGTHGSDRARASLASISVRGSGFYRVSTPEFPLVQAVAGSGGRVVARGEHELTVRFAAPLPEGPLSAWIDGARIAAGPRHRGLGATPAGLSFSVGAVERLQDGRSARVRVTASQAMGRVPDRIQDIDAYSALAGIDLVIAAGAAETRAVESRGHGRARLGADPRPLPPLCAEPGPDGPLFLKSWELEIEDGGAFPGRYLRKIRIGTGDRPGADFFDNAGPVTRSLDYRIRKELVRIPSLEGGPASCPERP